MRFMMQSSIMVKGKHCDGSLKILEGFISPIDATVYKKCIGAEMTFVGLVAPYQLGAENIFDENDESDAAIDAILDGRCDVVLCSDTFGRVARKAAENELFFLQGAYGTVSRYGVMPLASSMDRVGILCRKIEYGVKTLNIVSGGDGKDAVCSERRDYKYSFCSHLNVTPFFCEVANVEYAKAMPAVFYILASAEVSNNISRYDGIKYGYRSQKVNSLEELYVRSRSEGLPKELKLMSVFGCMVLQKDNYERLYIKSMQLRRLIRDYYSKLLDNHGILAFPLNHSGKDGLERLAVPAIASLCGFTSLYANYCGRPCLLVSNGENEDAMLSLFGKETV